MKLTELQVDELRSHMVHEEDLLKTKFKAKSNQFETVRVLHNEVEDYERLGYSVTSIASRKTTMTRRKAEDVIFEDDIWCMFYSLGFRILNKDEQLRIQWGPNKEDTQQIDVLAVGDDAIFVVECKAADKPKAHSFKKELNGIEQYMSGIRDAVRQVYGRDKKVKFIFATRNYRFVDEGEDKARMQNAGIFHLNDNSYDYITNLIKSYKTAVIYQFYGLMFKDELINNDRVEIPALRGKMGGKNYYLFSVEPSTLLKIGFVLHRTRVNDSMAPTYQRLLIPSRLKGITKFINEGGYFPNSIIINFSAEKKKLRTIFTPVNKSLDSNAELGILSIPNAYGIAYIIDGQHRVYGYANSEYKDKNTIPVVAFEDMPSEEQLKIFMEINENQKAVSPSLRLDLEEDLYWDSKYIDSRMKALRSSIIKNLSGDSNSILYNKISVGEDSAALSFKPFDTALGKSGLLPKANKTQWVGDNSSCLYNINETDSSKEMKEARTRIAHFISECYDIIDQSLIEDYTKDEFLFSNRATFAVIALIGSLNQYLYARGDINSSSTIKDRLLAITPYLKALANGLNNLLEEDSMAMRGFKGQGADSFWLHHYQKLVNKQFSDYDPEELQIFKETQDKTIQEEGNKLKNDIRDMLKDVVFIYLEKVYGRSWENSIRTIVHDIEGRMLEEDEQANLAEWKDWVEVSDLRKMINNNFSYPEFEEVFTIDLGLGLAMKSKKDKLAWLDHIESTKKKQAITRSEINRLGIISDHLAKYIE